MLICVALYTKVERTFPVHSRHFYVYRKHVLRIYQLNYYNLSCHKVTRWATHAYQSKYSHTRSATTFSIECDKQVKMLLRRKPNDSINNATHFSAFLLRQHFSVAYMWFFAEFPFTQLSVSRKEKKSVNTTAAIFNIFWKSVNLFQYYSHPTHIQHTHDDVAIRYLIKLIRRCACVTAEGLSIFKNIFLSIRTIRTHS